MPAILLYVGCRGRTFKEAQSNLSVLLFAVSLLPIVQMFLQRKEPAWLTWIPVSGQYALLSRALRGEALPCGSSSLQSYVVPGALLTLVALLGRRAALLARVGAGRASSCRPHGARGARPQADAPTAALKPSCRITASGGCRIVPRVPSQPASVTTIAPPPTPYSQTIGLAENGIWNTRSDST